MMRVLAALGLPCWSKNKKLSHLHSGVNITSDKKKRVRCVVLEIVSAFETKDTAYWWQFWLTKKVFKCNNAIKPYMIHGFIGR